MIIVFLLCLVVDLIWFTFGVLLFVTKCMGVHAVFKLWSRPFWMRYFKSFIATRDRPDTVTHEQGVSVLVFHYENMSEVFIESLPMVVIQGYNAFVLKRRGIRISDPTILSLSWSAVFLVAHLYHYLYYLLKRVPLKEIPIDWLFASAWLCGAAAVKKSEGKNEPKPESESGGAGPDAGCDPVAPEANRVSLGSRPGKGCGREGARPAPGPSDGYDLHRGRRFLPWRHFH